MQRIVIGLVVLASVGAALYFYREPPSAVHYTGFVEGEERVIRSEVNARVLEVRFHEGDTVPADEIIAVLDSRDIDSRIESKRRELAVFEAEIRAAAEKVELVEATWQTDRGARHAEVQMAESAAEVADRTFNREAGMMKSGATTAQMLDDNRARRDQARSALSRAHDLAARTLAEGRQVSLAKLELTAVTERKSLAEAQLAELEVARTKYTIRAPSVETIVQTRFLWPAELAQPGTPVVSLLDPKDKYVQVYVPVASAADLAPGRRVAIEIDGRESARIPGEISFIADKATFTPEKIETRGDRLGQVYRVKVRILEQVESMRPGSEGNVYLLPSA